MWSNKEATSTGIYRRVGLGGDWERIGNPDEVGGKWGPNSENFYWSWQIKKLLIHPTQISYEDPNSNVTYIGTRMLATTSQGIYMTNNAEAENADNVDWFSVLNKSHIESFYPQAWPGSLDLTMYDIERKVEADGSCGDCLTLFASGTVRYKTEAVQSKRTYEPCLFVSTDGGINWEKMDLPPVIDLGLENQNTDWLIQATVTEDIENITSTSDLYDRIDVEVSAGNPNLIVCRFTTDNVSFYNDSNNDGIIDDNDSGVTNYNSRKLDTTLGTKDWRRRTGDLYQ